MKQIFKIYLLAVLSIGMTACDKDKDPVIEPQLEVNYRNVSGNWELTEWKGEVLPKELDCYLKLNRLDNTFEIYDNLGSMYPVKTTGTYEISGDKYDGYILTGVYDYTHEDWNEYMITSLTQSVMTLVKKEDLSDISVYSRCDSIPAHILE